MANVGPNLDSRAYPKTLIIALSYLHYEVPGGLAFPFLLMRPPRVRVRMKVRVRVSVKVTIRIGVTVRISVRVRVRAC